MLSDAGSRVIRAFGILNTNIPADHKMMYGIPWPGDFLIAPDGTVRDKLFLRNYEHRVSASAVVLRHYGADHGNFVRLEAGPLSATIAISTDRAFPGQELGLALDLRLAPGWHVYGKPLPANYQALALTLESPLLESQSLEMPAPQPLHLQALGETLPVYGGELKARGKLGLRWSPPMPAKFLETLGTPIEPGAYRIKGTLRFQACSDEVCEAPQTLTFELPLTVEAYVPPAPKQ